MTATFHDSNQYRLHLVIKEEGKEEYVIIQFDGQASNDFWNGGTKPGFFSTGSLTLNNDSLKNVVVKEVLTEYLKMPDKKQKQPLITAIVNSGATADQLNTIFTTEALGETTTQQALVEVLKDSKITADKQPLIKAIVNNCQDTDQLKTIFTQDALKETTTQTALVEVLKDGELENKETADQLANIFTKEVLGEAKTQEKFKEFLQTIQQIEQDKPLDKKQLLFILQYPKLFEQDNSFLSDDLKNTIASTLQTELFNENALKEDADNIQLSYLVLNAEEFFTEQTLITADQKKLLENKYASYNNNIDLVSALPISKPTTPWKGWGFEFQQNFGKTQDNVKIDNNNIYVKIEQIYEGSALEGNANEGDYVLVGRKDKLQGIVDISSNDAITGVDTGKLSAFLRKNDKLKVFALNNDNFTEKTSFDKESKKVFHPQGEKYVSVNMLESKQFKEDFDKYVSKNAITFEVVNASAAPDAASATDAAPDAATTTAADTTAASPTSVKKVTINKTGTGTGTEKYEFHFSLKKDITIANTEDLIKHIKENSIKLCDQNGAVLESEKLAETLEDIQQFISGGSAKPTKSPSGCFGVSYSVLFESISSIIRTTYY